MSDVNAARNQATNEVNSGVGRADTGKMERNAADAYNSQRDYLEKLQEDAKKKS